MFSVFLIKNLVSQASPLESITIILIFSSTVALALSVGLFIALIYILRRQGLQQQTDGRSIEAIASKIVEEKVSEIAKRYSELSGEIRKLEEKVSKISQESSAMASRLNNIDTRVTILEKRTKREDRLKSLLYPRPPEEKVEKVLIRDLQSLGDLKLYVPQVRYAAIITSQGYIVEGYGQGNEDPSKLLEIAKLTEKFANSRNVSITRGNVQTEIFYIGNMEDLSVYGIVEVEKNVNRKTIQSLRESLIRYFNKKFRS